MNKEAIMQRIKALEAAEQVEILAEEATHLLLWDGEKESLLRFPDTWDKQTVVEDIAGETPSTIDRTKLIALLEQLDDALFMSVKKIVFIDSEETYWALMQQHFENTDMLAIEEEVGKYLYYEDWVLINLPLIRLCAKDVTENEADYQKEVNIGLWTTLLHELRHGVQFTVLFEDDVDAEVDAEDYAIRVFEAQLQHVDYAIIH